MRAGWLACGRTPHEQSGGTAAIGVFVRLHGVVVMCCGASVYLSLHTFHTRDEGHFLLRDRICVSKSVVS